MRPPATSARSEDGYRLEYSRVAIGQAAPRIGWNLPDAARWLRDGPVRARRPPAEPRLRPARAQPIGPSGAWAGRCTAGFEPASVDNRARSLRCTRRAGRACRTHAGPAVPPSDPGRCDDVAAAAP